MDEDNYRDNGEAGDDPLPPRHADRQVAPDHGAGQKREDDQQVGDSHRSADRHVLTQGQPREQADKAQYPADHRHAMQANSGVLRKF